MRNALAPADGGFCARVWTLTAELQEAIRRHPFNQALAAGTLDRDRFVYYLVQDARYLIGFSRALAVASTRAPSPHDAAFLARSSHTALVVERNLHAGYLDRYSLSDADAQQIPTSPSCLAYASYLQATALAEPFPVIIAALLPCFWIYHHVGSGIHRQTGTDPAHPYRDWIATYADETFAQNVTTMKSITNEAARGAVPDTIEAMARAFCRASEYEWMFWESAWRQEIWQTAQWLPNETMVLIQDPSVAPSLTLAEEAG
jgi:thiaminase (transcriptional activator TenA)